jgi:hypothetical protein
MRDRHLDKLPVAVIAAIFATRHPLANYPERFKIAPTDPALSRRFNPNIKRRTLDALTLGSPGGAFSEPFQVGNGDAADVVATRASHSNPRNPRTRKSLVRRYDFASISGYQP